MVFSSKGVYCYCRCCCTLSSIIDVSVASVRTVRVCTLCIFDSVVGCALCMCFFCDKRRMMVPFGGTGLMEEHTASRIRTKRGQYYPSGVSILINNQPQTYRRNVVGKLSTVVLIIDSAVSQTTKLGHFTCSKRIGYLIKRPLVNE